ncbi:hypothetical protein KX928_18465 [Roseobacter sp. YSTF-M11]|uniref:Uncharacterized protein n=1 Tax=Roseobacter insulae TaxID=2859783 RepID=A0A9X1FY11_9RHOB|nr:hypothetical protein [Roseobacter insulae]MBW4709776.1 hypothetical protein [Roseobacter insulae]
MTRVTEFYDEPGDITPDISPVPRTSSWRATGGSPVSRRPGPKCPTKWRFTDWAAV